MHLPFFVLVDFFRSLSQGHSFQNLSSTIASLDFPMLSPRVVSLIPLVLEDVLNLGVVLSVGGTLMKRC